MCGICGCDAPQAHEHHPQHHHGHSHDGGHDHEHVLADGTVIRHSHGHDHAPAAVVETLNFAGRGAPVSDGARLLTVQRDILEKNDSFARFNRTVFDARGVLALNLVSSPGSGKTTLLVETLKRLHGRLPAAVIEGDQATDLDGARIRQTGAPAIQVNTGKACHLDARMVGEAAARLDPQAGSVLFIENVGNLVCPAGFDLGERSKIVLASVTEGEDKPLKYPDIFAASDLALITKIDLADVLDFDIQALIDNARKVNPRLAVLCVSARTGAGLEEWIGWIEARLGGRAAVEAAE